jgi:hypothetical protein
MFKETPQLCVAAAVRKVKRNGATKQLAYCWKMNGEV